MLYEKLKEKVAKQVYNQITSPFTNSGELALLKTKLYLQDIKTGNSRELRKELADMAYDAIMRFDARCWRDLIAFMPSVKRYSCIELTDRGWELF